MSAHSDEKLDAYGVLAQKIFDALEHGNVPWHKPWLCGPPRSLSTGKVYRGFNQLLLGFLNNEHSTPFWGTFQQLNDLGGTVRKGEHSTPVSFWKELEFPDATASDGSKKFLMCRYYRAFNASQVNWRRTEPRMIREWRDQHIQADQGNPHDRAEAMIGAFPNAPKFENKGMVAVYSPSKDKVSMPKAELFESQAAYYSTLFHEYIHSTGHPDRLHRFEVGDKTSKEEYSKEELTAEIGSAFLCHEAGIQPQVQQNAAYCKSWLAKLTQDPRILIGAASLAAKAADHFLGRDRQAQAAPEIAQVVPQVQAGRGKEEAEAEM